MVPSLSRNIMYPIVLDPRGVEYQELRALSILLYHNTHILNKYLQDMQTFCPTVGIKIASLASKATPPPANGVKLVMQYFTATRQKDSYCNETSLLKLLLNMQKY